MTVVVTAIALPLMFLGGVGAFWAGVGSNVWQASLIAIFPFVVVAVTYPLARRRATRRTAWNMAMALALPAVVLSWLFIASASAM